MNINHLSKRLMAVAKQVPVNSRLADIGSDHAYLPIYLAENKQIQYGVVGEVAAGPLDNAKEDILNANLDNVLMPRLADGLAAIKKTDAVDVITIAGMGGTLITSILENGQEKLVHRPRLILQPNVNAKSIRSWLIHHHYQLSNEFILEEDGHIYEILVADGVDVPKKYSEEELTFGPFLLKKHSATFVAKWEDKLRRLNKVLVQMNKAADVPEANVNKIKVQIDTIKGVLNQ